MLDWQIVQSLLTLCSNFAPIVFLLVVGAAFSFKELNKHTTEEYLQLLGDCVWNHTIVLFTTVVWMEDVDMEQLSERKRTPCSGLEKNVGTDTMFLIQQRREKLCKSLS